jgi:hypothetical protein
MADRGTPAMTPTAVHHLLHIAACGLDIVDAVSRNEGLTEYKPSEKPHRLCPKLAEKTFGSLCTRYFGTEDRFILENLEGKEGTRTGWSLQRTPKQTTIYHQDSLRGPQMTEVEKNTYCHLDENSDEVSDEVKVKIPSIEVLEQQVLDSMAYLEDGKLGIEREWTDVNYRNEAMASLFGNLSEFNPLHINDDKFEILSDLVSAVPAWKPGLSTKATTARSRK